MHLKSLIIYKDTLLYKHTADNNLERKREDRIEEHIRMIRFKRYIKKKKKLRFETTVFNSEQDKKYI